MEDASALLVVLRRKDRRGAEEAARSLRILAEQNPEALKRHSAEVLRLAMAEQDLRVRWNLMQVLGKIVLKPVQRGAAIDWLFERLRDASPFTRTFALQALYDLSREDESLHRRWLPIAEEFARNGTAAMRARARKLLQSGVRGG